MKYLDGAVINRPFEEGDYWDDGSEDGETYSLYAIWTENKSPEQKEAEEKLAAAEEAISGTYNPKYGTDTNALTMIRAKLTAAGITDITVAMKEAAYSSWNYVASLPTAPSSISGMRRALPCRLRHRAPHPGADIQGHRLYQGQ